MVAPGAERRMKVLAGHLQQEAHEGLLLSAPVREALSSGRAVVALESTIITHGMPFPQNLQTAREVERIVRDAGAEPATIAILDGQPCVGLTDQQLERLARLGQSVRKTSRRDLPAVMGLRMHGSTTVSATMILAARAGITVFVTGGIGGVHRGGESTMDISADLTELGRTPVAVVCAGAKSVLDIPRTLEFLETQGVTVAAYQADEFPAFFTPHSGCAPSCRVDSPQEAAEVIRAGLALSLGSGFVFGVPIPSAYQAAAGPVQRAIDTALEEVVTKRITGNEVTPFLLQRVQELSGGVSLSANIALIKHNALVGSQIAVALTTR